MTTVFLIGFMGSGKTSVGRALAAKLGRPFIDTDREIERSAGRTIRRLFAEEGEAAFRKREAAAVRRAARRRGAIVALGGGAVTRPENVRAMRRSGRVVYLQASFPALQRWITPAERAKRPLWRDARRLYRVRRPLYEAAAHLTVRVGDGIADRIAGRIIRRLGLREAA